jgi:hypothetical protein
MGHTMCPPNQSEVSHACTFFRPLVRDRSLRRSGVGLDARQRRSGDQREHHLSDVRGIPGLPSQRPFRLDDLLALITIDRPRSVREPQCIVPGLPGRAFRFARRQFTAGTAFHRWPRRMLCARHLAQRPAGLRKTSKVQNRAVTTSRSASFPRTKLGPENEGMKP